MGPQNVFFVRLSISHQWTSGCKKLSFYTRHRQYIDPYIWKVTKKVFVVSLLASHRFGTPCLWGRTGLRSPIVFAADGVARRRRSCERVDPGEAQSLCDGEGVPGRRERSRRSMYVAVRGSRSVRSLNAEPDREHSLCKWWWNTSDITPSIPQRWKKWNPMLLEVVQTFWGRCNCSETCVSTRCCSCSFFVCFCPRTGVSEVSQSTSKSLYTTDPKQTSTIQRSMVLQLFKCVSCSGIWRVLLIFQRSPHHVSAEFDEDHWVSPEDQSWRRKLT